MEFNTNMSSKKHTKDETAYRNILLLIREIELMYNLSNGLSKRRRQYIRDRFKKIWKNI